MVASNHIKFAALALSLGIIVFNGVNDQAFAKSTKKKTEVTVTTKSTVGDEPAVRAQLAEMAKQLAAGNAAQLAALWAIDGEYIDEDGNRARGRKEIENRFSGLFSQGGKPQVHLAADTVKFLAPTVAIVEGTVQRDRDGQTMPDSHFSLVLVKGADGWLMSRASESPVVATSNYDYLRQLDWIIGEWDAKGSNASVHLKAEWVPSKNFIINHNNNINNINNNHNYNNNINNNNINNNNIINNNNNNNNNNSIIIMSSNYKNDYDKEKINHLHPNSHHHNSSMSNNRNIIKESNDYC